MNAIRSVLRFVIRFFVVWVISALSLIVTARILPGINLVGVADYPAWAVAFFAAFLLGLINLLIRPLLLLLAMPLGFIVLFIVGFFVNAVTLRITANLMDGGLTVDGWLPAIIGGIVLALINTLIAGLLGVDDGGSFYEGIIERRLTRQRVDLPENPSRGLVMLEIDGLSYHHIQKAIADGYMPTVKQMIERDGYVLSKTDCGLPSQTSACQTGILFGDNHDIPAFRWYDKSRKKLFVSGNDAAEINARYAKGQGLLRGGASVNNMMNGDATLSLLTASDLRGGTPEQKRARAADVYLLLLNPNFFMRVIGLVIGEAVTEVWQYGRDVAAGVQPRLNRLHKFYPFVRAATTVFMREVSGFLTLMQIVRGEPAMYTTWPGYDEVAHHSGPWSKHAFGTLRGFDRFIATTREIIATKAPRQYELLLLSDHGQSFGPTFLMRYGYTLKEFIERNMPEGTVIHQTMGGDDGSLSVTSVAAELGNMQEQEVGGRVSQAAARQMQRAAESAAEQNISEETLEGAADVTFCGSGNLGQVYFHAFPQRASISELNAAFPGMVDAVIGHEGVGLVVGTNDDGVPVVYGKKGTHNLHTGEVQGEDPLLPYGDVEVRAWQVRRVADFPSAGDLIIVSTLYPDGTVAALEELIGNHGGMGGEQTDSFLLHPADFEIPARIRSVVDIFPLLNARRDLPPLPVTSVEMTTTRDDWAPSNLLAGLRRVGDWVELALRSLILDRTAYRAIADFSLITGPALLISLVGVLITTLMNSRGSGFATVAGLFVGNYALWLVAVAAIHMAARILRGKANFTQTFRVMGFIQAISFLELPRLILAIEPTVVVGVALLSLIATWIGVAEAHRLRGWRTLILPVLYFLILILGVLVLGGIMGGLRLTFESLGQRFGILP